MQIMSSSLFGTDGIRGPAGTYPLDEAGLHQIGKAAAVYFVKSNKPVLIGWDPRESSEGMAEATAAGLQAAGAQVQRVGVIPTPGLAYLTKERQAAAGVIITASHNPYTDNGVKLFTPDGRKLSDADQAGINKLIDETLPDDAGGAISDASELLQAYEDFLVAVAGQAELKGLKLAADSANGATSGLAARVFERLEASVTPLFDKPDGRNINVACGATDSSALEAAVKQQGLDAGVAFDGDGDRVILVDGRGRPLSGDHILYILAVSGSHKGVVATIMSNQGLETALKKHGITLERTAVGDRYVLDGMDKTGYRLGGEQSGHIILSDHATTGDGLLAAIVTLMAVQASGKSLADWRDELTLLPQALVNIALPDRSRLETYEVQAFLRQRTAELGSDGRINIRPSGTEPKLRIMVEADNAEIVAQKLASELAELLKTGDKV